MNELNMQINSKLKKNILHVTTGCSRVMVKRYELIILAMKLLWTNVGGKILVYIGHFDI